ncbi:MAG: 5-oxoprolinase [Acidobacteria bacterium]|nr:MAG: 5-oxoprolinase [Acidobacteriota bacterium]
MSRKRHGTGEPERPWRFAIDVGGTFTDVLAEDPSGAFHRVKVLSSGALRGTVEQWEAPDRLRVRPGWRGGSRAVRGARLAALGRKELGPAVESYDPASGRLRLAGAAVPELIHLLPPGGSFELRFEDPAPLVGIRLVTDTPAGDPLPPVSLRLGTTLATNALLTRSGAEVVLFVTAGHGDLLRIGTQERPDLFALSIERPPPLYAAVVEVDERTGADGTVVRPLDIGRLRRDARAQLAAGRRSAAVALLHADRYPDHETAVARVLREEGFEHVSCSHEMARSIKILPRAETAVVDARLAPVVSRNLAQLAQPVGGRLLVMTSAGGLVGHGEVRAKDILLSGPAGGVAGARVVGERAGASKVIGFDMGGTSTDVCRIDGDFEYVFEHRVGDAHLVAPALAIETVAAGGGSVCAFDASGLRVGPESAGAHPGPACYGAGGPLAVTDVNLLLGRLDPARLEIPIDRQAAERAAEALRRQVERGTGEPVALDEMLEGLLELAHEKMASAIRAISLSRGYAPEASTLVAFGGAGGQHATAVAARLGMTRVLVPADAGLLSALGIAAAAIERFAERQVLAPLARVGSRVPGWLSELEREAAGLVAREGIDPRAIGRRRALASLRFAGQEATVEVDVPADGDLAAAFRSRYRDLFGHLPEARPIELVSLRVVAGTRPEPVRPAPIPERSVRPEPRRTIDSRFEGRWLRTPVFDRESLEPGAAIDGPALVCDRFATTVVEPGWKGRLDAAGTLVLERGARRGAPAVRRRPRAVRLELFTHRLERIASEMGLALERSAVSTNVKERRDFSCAVLDRHGRLVVNAPHIPVHLGSLGLCVRRVIRERPLDPGDVVVTNHPRYGGSHLPDVTVIAPVDAGGVRIGYVAARAHHAELGGTRPGSMPPDATRLVEEGVVIPPFRLVRNERADWDALRRLLTGAPYPTRALADNLADVAAAVAACHRGATKLAELAREEGIAAVMEHMEGLERRAERAVRDALRRLGDGRSEDRTELDDGTPLAVRIDVRGGTARFDFTGTGGVHPGNLNATPAIVRSVVLYVLRLLVREPIPLNEGLMAAVDLVVPFGLLSPHFPDDPAACPAVVGGNVETSQRLADLLVHALGLAAESQGTMNNVLFGDGRASYYETICGGAGAGPGFHGASAVHTHMTNTRITDPEILEHRFPVRLERFAIRHGSGGAGRWRGGDGVVRELTFLAPLELSVLTQRRREGPRGARGGGAGLPGAQRLRRAGGATEELPAIAGTRVGPGDRLVVETPGGGGWGAPAPALGQLRERGTGDASPGEPR